MNWLLLRGLVREQRHWHSFPTHLLEHFPESKIHYLDYPGIGTEVSRDCPANITAIMEDVRSRWLDLRKTADSRPWALVSVSLGGMVSLDWVIKHPDDFTFAFIGSSSVGGFGSVLDRFSPSSLFNFPKFLLTHNLLTREKTILKMTTNLDPKSEAFAKRATEQASYAPPTRKFRATAISQLRAGAAFKIPRNAAATVKTKLHFTVSLGDRLVKPVCSERISKFFNAPLYIHPTANHDIPTDEPVWLAKTIAKALKG